MNDRDRTQYPRQPVDKAEEARARIELANSGFADRCLTTWLPRREAQVIAP
jgi:hypothetical protein